MLCSRSIDRGYSQRGKPRQACSHQHRGVGHSGTAAVGCGKPVGQHLVTEYSVPCVGHSYHSVDLVGHGMVSVCAAADSSSTQQLLDLTGSMQMLRTLVWYAWLCTMDLVEYVIAVMLALGLIWLVLCVLCGMLDL